MVHEIDSKRKRVNRGLTVRSCLYTKSRKEAMIDPCVPPVATSHSEEKDALKRPST